MIILSGHSMTAADRFRPESMGLNLEERKSTANVTTALDAPEVAVGTWLMDDTDPGSGIIWRVKTVDTQYNTQTRTLQLEHVINTLRDEVMFGEVKPKDITGNASAKKCTAREAIEYILGRQAEEIWELGTFDYESVENPYSFNGDNLFAALETVTASLEDAWWDIDLSRMPFRIHIRHLGDTVSSEMRMDRNIQTMKKTVDRSRMYTRFYPIGKNDLHLEGDYVSRNEDAYGLIARVETDQSKETAEELEAWAEERLSRHCEPNVTITISGLDLSGATGESLDSFAINYLCRVPLPEFGTTITEKITKLSWSDKIREKEKVTVTLASVLEDVASIISNQNASGGKGGRAAAKKAGEDHAWFVDTDDHVAMVAEAIIGRGPDGVDWSRVAQLIVDGDGIHGRVTRAEGYMVVMASRIDQTEESLTIAMEDMIACTRSEFRLTSESMRIAFERDLDSMRGEVQMSIESLRIAFQNETGSIRSVVSVEAGKISQIVTAVGADGEVTAASIVAAINASTGDSEVRIDAGHVYIGNSKSTTVINGKLNASDVTSDYLATKIAAISNLNVNQITAGAVYIAPGGATASQVATQTYVSGSVYDLRLQSSGNTYTLQKKALGGDGSWTDVGSFSRATSLTGAWSGGTYTATASPQGNTCSTTLRALEGTGNVTKAAKFVSRNFIVQYGPDGDHLSSTGATLNATINASSVWDDGEASGKSTGWSLARGKVSYAPAGTSSSMTVSFPGDSYDSQVSQIYSLYSDQSYCYIKNAAGTVVARTSNLGAQDAANQWTPGSIRWNKDSGYFETFGCGSYSGQMNAHFLPSQVSGLQMDYPSSMTTSSSSGSYTKQYSIPTTYKYGRFTVSCGGKSATFQIKLLDA